MERVCFGTSTFVAGRLSPGKDSEPGVTALVRALSDGLDWVHTNPSLGTQWAVRTAWERADRPPLRHAVKVESPITPGPAPRSAARRSVERSLHALEVSRVHAAVLEIDLKGTEDLGALSDPARVRAFYAQASEEVLATGDVTEAFAYCHSPQHLAAALAVESVTGVAAQFSPAETWPRRFFPELRSRRLPFLGMAPLWRGRLTARAGPGGPPATTPLAWVLNHTDVSRAVVTVSSVDHWEGVLAATRERYDPARERGHFEAWGLDWPPDPLTSGAAAADAPVEGGARR